MDPQNRNRFFGIYSAIVVSISDPLNKYRLKVQIPQLHAAEITNWIPACLPMTHLASQVAPSLTTTATTVTSGTGPSYPSGTHTHQVTIPALTITAKTTPVLPALPKVGQNVWVMFQAGDPEYPVWIGVQP
jgi:guanyl-specific ribonuclease Sa